MLQLRLAIRQWVGPANLTTTPRSRVLAPSLLSSRLYSTDTPPPPTPELSEDEQNIYQKLTEQFAPSALRVQDVSGACIPSYPSGELDKFRTFLFTMLICIPAVPLGGCGSFYAIIIASDRFKGLSMVKQHQLVNQALKAEIKTIHGLQVCSFKFCVFSCITWF